MEGNYTKFLSRNNISGELQQRFKGNRQDISTITVNKVTLSINAGKRMQKNDWIQTFADGATKEIIYNKEKINKQKVNKMW